MAVLRGEVLPDGDRLHVADEAHGERRGQHLIIIMMIIIIIIMLLLLLVVVVVVVVV